MVGIKLLWTGIVFVLIAGKYLPHSDIAGAVLMGVGLVLLWLDK